MIVGDVSELNFLLSPDVTSAPKWRWRNVVKTILRMAIAAAGVLVLIAGTASAEIVCNDDGDCWHVKTHVDYPADVRAHVHADDWRWKDHEKFRWREHEGRGYWRGGTWIDIK